MVTNINPMTDEIVGGEPRSATTDSVGAATLHDSLAREQDGVELHSKNQRRSAVQEQIRSYANRDSIARLSRVGGTKKKGKKEVLFAIGSSDRDQVWAPSATKQRSRQEQSAETEIKAPPADGLVGCFSHSAQI
jgi:hypothetical protein